MTGRKHASSILTETDFKNNVHAILNNHEISYDWPPFSQKGREVLASEDLSLGIVARQLIVIDQFEMGI